jgi:hypothetical protein
MRLSSVIDSTPVIGATANAFSATRGRWGRECKWEPVRQMPMSLSLTDNFKQHTQVYSKHAVLLSERHGISPLRGSAHGKPGSSDYAWTPHCVVPDPQCCSRIYPSARSAMSTAARSRTLRCLRLHSFLAIPTSVNFTSAIYSVGGLAVSAQWWRRWLVTTPRRSCAEREKSCHG